MLKSQKKKNSVKLCSNFVSSQKIIIILKLKTLVSTCFYQIEHYLSLSEACPLTLQEQLNKISKEGEQLNHATRSSFGKMVT